MLLTTEFASPTPSALQKEPLEHVNVESLRRGVAPTEDVNMTAVRDDALSFCEIIRSYDIITKLSYMYIKQLVVIRGNININVSNWAFEYHVDRKDILRFVQIISRYFNLKLFHAIM